MSEKGIVAAVILIMLLIVAADGAYSHNQPNNEPYTGLCVEPTPQGGC